MSYPPCPFEKFEPDQRGWREILHRFSRFAPANDSRNHSGNKFRYNSKNADRHVAGTISEEELGDRLSGDAVRMNAERAHRGLDPR